MGGLKGGDVAPSTRVVGIQGGACITRPKSRLSKEGLMAASPDVPVPQFDMLVQPVDGVSGS